MVKVEQPEQPEKKPVPLLISPGRPQSVPVNVCIWPPRPVIRRPPDRQFKWPQSVRGASDSQPVIRRPQERPESVRVIVGIWPAPRKPVPLRPPPRPVPRVIPPPHSVPKISREGALSVATPKCQSKFWVMGWRPKQ